MNVQSLLDLGRFFNFLIFYTIGRTTLKQLGFRNRSASVFTRGTPLFESSFTEVLNIASFLIYSACLKTKAELIFELKWSQKIGAMAKVQSNNFRNCAMPPSEV
jgi:hypothetical protein